MARVCSNVADLDPYGSAFNLTPGPGTNLGMWIPIRIQLRGSI
jgi:hypothetical protein